MVQAKNPIAALTSRRNFIASGAALAVASVSTVALAKAGIARPAPEHADRALLEAIAEWQRGHVEQERLSDIHSQLEDLAGETEPTIPSELFEALEMPSGKRLPTDRAVGWPEPSLRDFAERGQLLQSSMDKLPNGAMRTDFWWDDISQATRQRAAELLQIRLAHTERVEAHWEKAKEAEDRFADQVSKQSDKMLQIVEMPACTGEGLAAKCQLLLAEPMFDDFSGEAGFIAKSLVADIQEAVNSGVIAISAVKAA
jgi:hypothetical protein